MHSDYSMMEGPPMMPFDNRNTSSSPLQRPVMAPQYVVTNSYTPGPLASIAPPPYQASNPYPFGHYQGPPTPPHQSPHFKTDYHERQVMAAETDNSRTPPFPRDFKAPYGEQAPSPARSDSQASISRSMSNPNLHSKTITSNQLLNPNFTVNFETEVDELMKAIQSKEERAPTECLQHPLTPASESGSEHATPGPVDPNAPPRKRYACNGPNCNKTFSQKTHLEIHRRTHTGDKPYVCEYPGCHLTFSQLGNLKTHIRRHTGERPFSCEHCGRKFAQRGNVRAHEQTHQGLKPFICKLDDCNKTFSQLGNMKTHQNNFHKQTLKSLTSRFAHILNSGAEIPEVDRELFAYFASHYKNSNKGIKGRGKARMISERKAKPPTLPRVNMKAVPAVHPKSPVSATGPASQFPLPQIPPPHQSYNHASHPGSLAAYSMSRGHPNMMNGMPRDHQPSGYEVFGMDGEPHATQPSQVNGLMYENDNGRDMGFAERIY